MQGQLKVPTAGSSPSRGGCVCLVAALLTSWMLGVPAWVFGVVFIGLAALSLVRPPNG